MPCWESLGSYSDSESWMLLPTISLFFSLQRSMDRGIPVQSSMNPPRYGSIFAPPPPPSTTKSRIPSPLDLSFDLSPHPTHRRDPVMAAAARSLLFPGSRPWATRRKRCHELASPAQPRGRGAAHLNLEHADAITRSPEPHASPASSTSVRVPLPRLPCQSCLSIRGEPSLYPSYFPSVSHDVFSSALKFLWR